MASKLFSGKYESTRTTTPITLQLPTSDAKAYKELAKKLGKPFNAIVLEALQAHYGNMK